MKIDEFREENGATLVVATMPGALSFSAFLGVRTGSRDDPAGQEGLAHLLEHLAFKDTSRRPTFRDVAVELDRVGAEFNAFTGREWLAFYVRGGSASASTALDVLVDMYTGSLVREETVAREKRVVVEGLRLNENDGRLRADDLMHQAMFTGTGMANPVGGSVETVEAVDAASVVAHMARHFTGPNTVLGLAGDVTPALVRQARRLLRTVPAADILRKGITTQELDRAVSYARGRLELGLGDPRGALLFLLRRACTDGYWEDPEEVIARTRAVSVDAVMDVLGECLSTPPVLCCVGPLEQADDALTELSAL